MKLSKFKKKAWDVFSKYIRIKYSDNNGYCKCVTCGVTKHWKEIHAGHFIDGRNNTILFDERFVYPQCFHCNSKLPGCLAGNKVKFTYFMITEKGFTIEQCNNYDNLKFSTKKVHPYEFEEIEHEYKIKLSLLLKSKGMVI